MNMELNNHAMQLSKKLRTICGYREIASTRLKTATCPFLCSKTYTRPSLLLVASAKEKQYNFINLYKPNLVEALHVHNIMYNIHTNDF